MDTSATDLSRAKFDQIQAGLTVEDVAELLGGEGALLSSSTAQLEPGITVAPLVTEVHEWSDDHGARVRVMFGNGLVRDKTQHGLDA
ncbi:MAG: hypothetical protein KJ052_03965 [Candidatus Hydrogenedentes bacterium]|nr:hypothetical protein [Candidatus Hydrogenedentota bacterium]